MHPTVARRSGAVRTSFVVNLRWCVPTLPNVSCCDCVTPRVASVSYGDAHFTFPCRSRPGPWFPPPPNPAGGFALPMAEPAAPAAPVKEDKDYVAEVIRQLRSP